MSHELETLARRLGERAAAGIDVERVASRVAARLRAGERVREPAGWRRAVAAAAAAAVLVGGTLVWRGADTSREAATLAAGPVPLGDLAPRALAELLDSLSLAAPVGELAATAILEDLDEEQLRELLATMEG